MNIPWASIAKIEADGVHSGTGFLVTPQHVLTARHVVADDTGRPFPQIKLRFVISAETGGPEPDFETGARLVTDLSSAQDDFALLLCDQPPVAKPLKLTNICPSFRECLAPGFAMHYPAGFTLDGRISSPNDPLEGGGTAIGIRVEFGTGIFMKGHSGAPVFIDNRVVGLLRTAFLDESQRATNGIVHATSVERVVDHCNRKNPGLLGFHAPIVWPPPSAVYNRILADRKEEFKTFEQMVTGQSKERVLLLKGDSGSGKSVLADELIKYARGLGIEAAQANCKDSVPIESVFKSILYDLPRQFLPTAEAAGENRFYAMVEDLMALEQPLVLAFDTWQDATPEVQKWVEQRLLSSLAKMPGVVVLIGGKKVPDSKSTVWGDLAQLKYLGVIRSTEDWFEYAQRKWPDSGIEAKHVEAYTLAVDGQPNTVDLLLEGLHQRLVALGSAGGGA